MAILAYGINYRTAAIDLRDRVAFPEDALGSALMDATRSISSLTEAALLSTCNRTEVYCAIDPDQEPMLEQWLANCRGVSVDVIRGAAYSHWDQDAARHLIRVAAGLDSQVLGEPQIMGQVKAACELARNLGTLGSELDLLSRVSLNAAKRVRTDTDIGRNPISVAYAAVAMAKRIFADLTREAALVGRCRRYDSTRCGILEQRGYWRNGHRQSHVGQRRAPRRALCRQTDADHRCRQRIARLRHGHHLHRQFATGGGQGRRRGGNAR